MEAANTAIKTTYLSILGNLLLATIKGLAGFFGNSYALIADAIESSADVLSSTLLLFGLKYSNKPADEDHPYGHGKIEPLVTFFIVAFLVISAFLIAYKGVINILSDDQEAPEAWTLIVLAVIIIWKELSYQYIVRKSKQINSTALKADAWHHRSDAITSIAAFIGISIALIFGKGFEVADDWAALFASGFILYNSYLILRPALGEIMDEHFYDDLIAEIRVRSLEVNGILATEKCFVRKSGMQYLIDLHAEVDGNISVADGHEIAHHLKDHLMETIPNISDVLIHIEPFEES
ncbi:MAG: cation transporter [Chitinophagales bacterium]|nr:cation transporter [Chitinophagales bacterium]